MLYVITWIEVYQIFVGGGRKGEAAFSPLVLSRGGEDVGKTGM